MNTLSRRKSPAAKASPKPRAAKPPSVARARKEKFAKNVVIATELAPAVAIALLEKTDQPATAPAPALECLAAGATASATEGKVRVQLMFENGAVLPVEMSAAAGAALSKGLSDELPPA